MFPLHPMYRLFELMGGDGTRLAAWRNQATEGTRVLVCNGMGVPPEAWPRLIADDCRFQVAGWNQRGVLGSDRPADPARIEIADHVSDAVALLDSLRWDDAIVVAWSLGVNVAFELANEHPDRVAGLLSVAGVPGGTFDTILAPQLVPRPLRRPLGLGIVHTGRLMAPQLNLLGKVLPQRRLFQEWIRFSGVVLPTADRRDIEPWVKAFFTQEWEWYFRLALALEHHGRIDPSFIEVPVTIVAGEFDALTAHDDVLEYARHIRHAEVHSLPGSHCLPLEYPDGMLRLIDGLVARIEAERAGRAYLERFRAADQEDSGHAWDSGRLSESGGYARAAVIPAARASPATASHREGFGGRSRTRAARRSTELPWWATDVDVPPSQ